jgi:hypothetical protein
VSQGDRYAGNLPIAWAAFTSIKSNRFVTPIRAVMKRCSSSKASPRSPEGILKVIKHTRREAMLAANDLLEGGMAFVTIIAEGRVYTIEEFALTILDPPD